MRNQVYICPRGKGYWMERVKSSKVIGRLVSGRYVSFDKVVWC